MQLVIIEDWITLVVKEENLIKVKIYKIKKKKSFENLSFVNHTALFIKKFHPKNNSPISGITFPKYYFRQHKILLQLCMCMEICKISFVWNSLYSVKKSQENAKFLISLSSTYFLTLIKSIDHTCIRQFGMESYQTCGDANAISTIDNNLSNIICELFIIKMTGRSLILFNFLQVIRKRTQKEKKKNLNWLSSSAIGSSLLYFRSYSCILNMWSVACPMTNRIIHYYRRWLLITTVVEYWQKCGEKR